MLVDFRVRNFRSFLKEQALSYRASNDTELADSHCVRTRFNAIPRLIRSAVVFGPNGSGKSNLLAALRTMRELVLFSTAYSELQFKAAYTPFATAESSAAPTCFCIDLLLQGVRYTYSFSYDQKHITAESLRVFRASKSQRWYERHFDAHLQADVWAPFSSNLPGAREMWRKATAPRALFLTTASQLNAVPFNPVVHWFRHQLEISLASDHLDLAPLAQRLGGEGFKSKVLSVLKAVDLPVVDVRVSRRGASLKPQESPAPTIEFLYDRDERTPMWIDSSHDSSGTQRLISLLCPLLDGIEKDCFVAIDEFDTHLHPLVARFLVQMINNDAFTHRHVQVLLISHTTSLMDLDILRRDELWLMESDPRYASRLKSMSRCSLRKHEIVARAYLKGKYGAVPKVDADAFEVLTGLFPRPPLPPPAKQERQRDRS
jgi:uncharacterized protein